MKKHSKKLIILSLLLLAVMVVGLMAGGCMGGTPKIAWSGPTVAQGNLYVGTLGKIVALNAENGNNLWYESVETEGTSGGFGCAMGATHSMPSSPGLPANDTPRCQPTLAEMR